MSTVTLCMSSPWSALSPSTTSALIAAGATTWGSARPNSLYDLMCNLDDTASLRAVRARTTDPVTLSALDSELRSLDSEHTEIRLASLTRFEDVTHDHI
ncbi:hypothetical protein ACFYPK_32685 [Streptomyces halstedii]|uniref:hypothetical protein n=1 Tax=Streptomyces halstedii TaxID=1944 RepID=UPI00345F3052